MTLQCSTEFKALLLAGFPAIFAGGHIRVFEGAQPPTSDYAEGSLLGIITLNGLPVGAGGGLRFMESGPYIVFHFADICTLVAAESGTAAWWRLVAPGDDGTARIDQPRIDGAIGTVAGTAELILPSQILTAGDIVSPLSFFYTIPPVLG